MPPAKSKSSTTKKDDVKKPARKTSSNNKNDDKKSNTKNDNKKSNTKDTDKKSNTKNDDKKSKATSSSVEAKTTIDEKPANPVSSDENKPEKKKSRFKEMLVPKNKDFLKLMKAQSQDRIRTAYLMFSIYFLLSFFTPIPFIGSISSIGGLFFLAGIILIFMGRKAFDDEHRKNILLSLGLMIFGIILAVVAFILGIFSFDFNIMFMGIVVAEIILYFSLILFVIKLLEKRAKYVMYAGLTFYVIGAIIGIMSSSEALSTSLKHGSLAFTRSAVYYIIISNWLMAFGSILYFLVYFMIYMDMKQKPYSSMSFFAPIFYWLSGEKKYTRKDFKSKSNRKTLSTIVGSLIVLVIIVVASASYTYGTYEKYLNTPEIIVPPDNNTNHQYPDDIHIQKSGSINDAPTPFLIKHVVYQIQISSGAKSMDVDLKGSGGGPRGGQLNLIVSGPAKGQSTASGMNQHVTLQNPPGGKYSIEIQCTKSYMKIDYVLTVDVDYPENNSTASSS